MDMEKGMGLFHFIFHGTAQMFIILFNIFVQYSHNKLLKITQRLWFWLRCAAATLVILAWRHEGPSMNYLYSIIQLYNIIFRIVFKK